MIPVFDGHNDFLLRLWSAPERRDAIWRDGDGTGHLDLPRMRAGGFAGGLFAIYVPSPADPADPDEDSAVAGFLTAMENPPYDLPLPAPVSLTTAQPVALAMAGHLMAMARAAPRDFRLCRDTAEVRAAMDDGAIAGVMHMEGAEAIGTDLDALHLFHALGLRSLGPVWSRPTAFGHGVPFRFPGAPDTGPGLTPAGRDLVRECDRLGILIDLSHLNAAGVEDVARISTAPLVATHSNAHAITPSTRNLTDRQLDMIRERDGIVGLNLATVFLRDDGRQAADCGIDPILRHLDHLIGRLGEGRVGLGSDFDGATIPAAIGDVAGLPRLWAALADHGYDTALIRRLACDNWLAALGRVWGG